MGCCFQVNVDGEKSKLIKQQDQIQTQIQEINTLLCQSNAKDLISGSDSLIKSITKTTVTPENTSFHGVPKFSHGDQTKIPLILGKLEDVSIQYNTELQVDKRFNTGSISIDKILFSNDDSLWLCDSCSGEVQKVKQNGDNLSVISNYLIGVHDVALLPSGDLLLSDGSSNLKLIPLGSTDIQDSVFAVSPLDAQGVHVTHENKVIIGAVDSDYTKATRSKQIIVMDQTGRHEKVFQYDRHGKPLFTFPHRITSAKIGNIAILDMVSYDWRGRVVLLDHEGETRNIYTGHHDVNNEHKPFIPRDITATPSDNFVVTDISNNTLHTLNCEGEIITFYDTEKMRILKPYSLSFSHTEQLYICGVTGEDSVENATMFKVKNFLF